MRGQDQRHVTDGGVEFVIPASPSGNPWCQILDTENIEDPFVETMTGETIILGGRSLKLLSDQAYQLAAPAQPKATR